MTMATKNDIFDAHLKEWLSAKGNKGKRGSMVRHLCFVTGMHPKSIPRSFRRVQMRDPGIPERRGRTTYYTPDVIAALKHLWDVASEPCGENLHAVIAEYVAILQRDGQWTYGDETTAKLLAMSMGTVKKRVATFSRQRFLTHGKGTTSPGAIHAQIPIRIGPWNDARVGTMQIDTVAHCGDSTAGNFVYTVNATDVATLWGTRRAQWNKGQEATVRSMEYMEKDIPVPVIEWHPDSGSEFVNWHCKLWCDERGTNLTRSRPNRKNDNCFVEERNGHVVRRWIGYTRFDARDVVNACNAVYDVLTPYLNHFVASKRTVSKQRIGARWIITREQRAQTPYERVLAHAHVSDDVKTTLTHEHKTMNPLVLKQEIDRRLTALFALQRHHGEPRSPEQFR